MNVQVWGVGLCAGQRLERQVLLWVSCGADATGATQGDFHTFILFLSVQRLLCMQALKGICDCVHVVNAVSLLTEK